MKIVTYNVNGLRSRISQFGSLHKLLNSFDADIICFQVPLFLSLCFCTNSCLEFHVSDSDPNQETKLRRQELTADMAVAEGYESFFSCTRTSDKGRMGYSGKVFVKMSQPNPDCWYIAHIKCFIACFDLLQVLLRSVA